MKYLCLAYGDEADWTALPAAEREALLAQDELLRRRGDLVAPVGTCTTVRVVEGQPATMHGPFAGAGVPLAGFSLIEARDLDQAVALMAKTPCAGAKGAVEIWPILEEGASTNHRHGP